MLIQAILIAVWAGICSLDDVGSQMLRRPLLTGTVAGLIMGDVVQGMAIGATLELMWMGIGNVGAYSAPDIVSGAIIGVSLGISTNGGIATGIALAVPVSLLCQQLLVVWRSFACFLNGWADKAVKSGDFDSLTKVHYFAAPAVFLLRAVPCFLAIYFGSDLISRILEAVPAGILTGLTVSSKLIPAVGICVLLLMLLKGRMWVFFLLGFMLTTYLKLPIIPALKRLYKDADKETRVRAMERHLEFYNSQVNTGALIMGVTAALEEKTKESEKEAVVSVKAGLMGPFAGLGDSLLKFTWLPICGSIGAAFALQGNILGPILMFLMFNAVNIGSRYYFIHYGYSKGVDLIEQSEKSNIIQRITNMANVVGVMVIGSLLATTVKVNTPLVISVGEQSIKVQEMFDKVMPNMLPLLFSLGIFFLLRRLQGKYTVTIIVLLMVFGVILSMLGVLK